MLDPLGPLDPVDTQTDENVDSVFMHCSEVTGCPRSDYLACQAYSQRKNCYELDRTICCAKHRDNCSTCSVSIALNKIPVRKVRVHVSTARMDVEGHVHLPLKMRFSDYINREEPCFIALTEAAIRWIDGSASAAENDVVVVNRDHIIVAWPIDDSGA